MPIDAGVNGADVGQAGLAHAWSDLVGEPAPPRAFFYRERGNRKPAGVLPRGEAPMLTDS
jgi:hypothetical protein